MSTCPATDGFRAAWCRGQAEYVTLAKIAITSPSPITLRFATNEFVDEAGVTWETGLSVDPINDGIEFLGPGPNLVSFQFHLEDRKISAQGAGTIAGTKISDILSAYRFKGATVTIYVYALGLLGSGEPVLQVISGRIGRTSTSMTEVTFTCAQTNAWDLTVPSKILDIVNAPNAIDGTLGVPYPIIGGSWRAPQAPPPFGAYTNAKERAQSGGGRLAVPMVVVDPGLTSGTLAHVAAAMHQCKKIYNATDGHDVSVDGDRLLCPLDSAGVTEVLGASESYITIADDKITAYCGIVPVDVCATAAVTNNTAGNPKAAMGPFDLSRFAVLDQGAGKTKLVLRLPNLSPLGRTLSVECVVAMTGDPANANVLRIFPVNPDAGTSGTTVASTLGQSQASTVSIVRGTWDAGWYTANNWDFGGAGGGAGNSVVALYVDFVGGAANKARIYWAGLIVKFAPSETLVTPASFGQYTAHRNRWGQLTTVYDAAGNIIDLRAGKRSGGDDRAAQPAVYRLSSQFFTNAEGQADDGTGGAAAGTFTGVVNALVERPPDLVRWLLTAFGGLNASTDFATTTGDHGAFTDARNDIRENWPDEFHSAIFIGEKSKLSDSIKRLVEDCLATCWLDRFTNLWRFGVWKKGAVADYAREFSWYDIDFIGAETLSDSDSIQEVRVAYGYDHKSQRTLWEAFVSPAGSSSGYNQPTFRSQGTVTISAANNRLDLLYNGTDYHATISSATYSTCVSLAQAVRAAMRATGAGSAMDCGYGFEIVAGYNDQLDYVLTSAPGTPLFVTLTAGSYTPEALAREVARALNAGGVVAATASWLASTNQFRIVASASITVQSLASAHATTTAWHALGFIAEPGGTTVTADVARYTDHYWITNNDNHLSHTLKWGTGTNSATCCAHELGWDLADTTSGDNHSGTYGRGMREVTAAAGLTQFGPRDPDQKTTDTILDEASAVRVVNRRFDLRVEDRVVLKFRTFFAPDMQRMRGLSLSSDCDAFVRFPREGTDGSWARKVFRVVNVVQYVGPQYHQEITAIEL